MFGDPDWNPRDEDFPNVPPEVKQRAREIHKDWQRIYVKRGYFVSAINSIESGLKHYIALYYEPREDSEFQWVLGHVETRDTVEVVRRIVTALGHQDLFDPWLRELIKLVEFRNDIAHSHVTDNLGRHVDSDDPLDWYADPVVIRGTPKEVQVTTEVLVTLDGWLQRLEATDSMLRFMELNLAIRSRDDPAEAARVIKSGRESLIEQGVMTRPP